MSVSTEFYQNIERPKSRFEVIVVAEIPLIIKTEIRPLKGSRPISHIHYISFISLFIMILDDNGFKLADDSSQCDEICLAR